jgi:AraC-like DNA-binding protein
MHQRRVLAKSCEDNILDIPKGLFGMRDVKPLLFSNDASIFYKDLEMDLVNVEFHTSAPCIVYIKSGKEVITTCRNESFEVGPGEMIFLPKGLILHSDYIHECKGLKAYLLFLGPAVLSEFLSTGLNHASAVSNEEAIFKIETGNAVKEYFASLRSVYGSLDNPPNLIQVKLLELLHLLDIHDDGKMRNSLLAVQRSGAKRNIKRLMEQYAISNLSSKEYAALSGRSVSAFNREFKALYGTSAKQWLIERRIEYAHSLLSEHQWSVTAAALEVGYGNVSHFISAFKKKYGKTPHQIKSAK